MTPTAIVWFRQDLRLQDNPALTEACSRAEQIIPLFIHENDSLGTWSRGSASRWWLHHSLNSLRSQLLKRGLPLVVRRGEALEVLKALMLETSVQSVFWNRLYTPDAIQRDARIKSTLRSDGVEVKTFNSALLFEPWEVLRGNGEPYRVFTPFWKAVQSLGGPPEPLPDPDHFPRSIPEIQTLAVEDLELLPRIRWDEGLYTHWNVGEPGALDSLKGFLDESVVEYDVHRDVPSIPGTSRLSPHLHFGEISPRQIFKAVKRRADSFAKGPACFLKEVGWREFAYHLLYHFPHTANEPLDSRFNAFPWMRPESELLWRWQRGQTGFPIIDAGMRELWQTGWMHNRVRMIVGSLLTKNLRMDWREGAQWFWDTLVDADLASNSLGWQWTAGCGADAAPFFRIFNPVLQGQRFDPEGHYVRYWVPEIRNLPDRCIHSPWTARADELAAAGVTLGQSYPFPVVDLQQSRAEALRAFGEIKGPIEKVAGAQSPKFFPMI